MVSIIKNQILKHLSKFTKDLTTDQFNFSTLKGEGKLTNLALEESVLTDLLELPSWLKLTSAVCNQVEFRIQWAKLKSVPIHLRLDEVRIEVVTCEELRTTGSSQGLSSYAGAAKYNFIHKVIDGITVDVNTVFVTFKSPAFTSTVELTRIIVESKSPEWKQVELAHTRVKDPSKEHVLLFKELTWQNAKIEAKSLNDANLTPLRLITNGATCRITLKKRIKDSCIMGSRMVVKLENILWVLTDMQMKAALHFLDSLSGLIQKATEIARKRKAARKLELLPEYQAQQSQHARTQEQPGVNQQSTKKPVERFALIDVVETSYHFMADKIELHFSDDNSDARSSYPELQKGAALQVSLDHFQVDFYPYHLAKASRSHWPSYQEGSQTEWLKNANCKFTDDLLASALNNCQFASRTDDTSPTGLTQEQAFNYIRNQLAMLMTSCFILRLADFTVYQVTTSASAAAKRAPVELVSAQRKRSLQGKGDKKRFQIPTTHPIFQAEFTYYYYPSDDPFPTPTPKLFVSVDPIQVHFDIPSILWLNSFALSLQQSLLMTNAAGNEDMVSTILTFDVNIMANNTRVIFESKEEYAGQRDRPQSLQFQISRARISNVRFTENGFRTDLEAATNAFRLASLFYHTRFPSDPQDSPLMIEDFAHYCEGTANDSPVEVASLEEVRAVLNSLPTSDHKDLWCVTLDSVSGCFYGARAVGKEHAVAFLDNLPVTLWIKLQVLPVLNIQVLAFMSSLISLQINHYQFLFLLRLSERLEELANHVAIDSARILKKPSDVSVVVGAVLPQVDVTLLMPSQTPGKSSSGGDMESFIPDTSSLQDDNWLSSSSAVNEKNPKSSEEHIRFLDKTVTELPAANGDVKTKIPQKPNNELDIKEPRRLSVGHISFTEETASTFRGLKRAWKRGVGDIMASLDIATGNQSPDEISSSISLQSDTSLDADALLPEGDNIDFFTGAITDVEEAAECIEEHTVTSPSEKDSFCNSLKRHDLVSICTFKLKRVEAQFQIQGAETLAKVEVASVGAGECPSIPWDEFQNKFVSRHRGSCDTTMTELGPRQIAVRLKRPEGGKASLPVAEIEARIQAVRLTLSASSIAGITELIEDELRPTPIPATILLEDIRLQIVDDRPLPHITSMEPPPVDIAIRHLLVRREASGLIEIPAPTVSEQPHRPVEGPILKRLQAENEDLRRRLAALERVTAENHKLKRYQEETEALRPSLRKAQETVEKLLDEKAALLDKVDLLNRRLSQSERSSKR